MIGNTFVDLRDNGYRVGFLSALIPIRDTCTQAFIQPYGEGANLNTFGKRRG